MKKTIILISFLIPLFMFSCKPKEQQTEETYAPVLVQKEQKKKILMHMMTWFWMDKDNKHPETQAKGNPWFGHWTMDKMNPEIIDSLGRRQIASHYYPLTGPYSSTDKNIIEYQLLLMKLAGVDGIIFNTSTLNRDWDFHALVEATDSIAKQTKKFGLEISIMYEDQHLRDNVGRGFLTDSTAFLQAKSDMEYYRDRYFGEPNYTKVDGRPLLTDFGPQYFTTEDQWTDIFSVFGENQPAFYALNYAGSKSGKNTYGEFAWVDQRANYHLDNLKHFYNTYEFAGKRMGTAYPGFRDFYTEGGWGTNLFVVPHRGDTTLVETLDLALASDSVEIIQLATWNDYGEGTMFEPTQEFGFTFLASLQRELGVKDLTEKDLELCFDLYQARLKFADNADAQKQLDEASSLMAALKIADARKIIEGLK
jgi:hypothetical protein